MSAAGLDSVSSRPPTDKTPKRVIVLRSRDHDAVGARRNWCEFLRKHRVRWQRTSSFKYPLLSPMSDIENFGADDRTV